MSSLAIASATEHEIAEAISTLAIYRDRFKGQSLDRYRPRKGSVMYKLWAGKRLEMHHQRAWHDYIRDQQDGAGSSGPVTSGYGESTSGRNPGELRIPVAFTTKAYQRLEYLALYLIAPERQILDALLADDLRPNGSVMLQKIGLHCVGYANDDQGRAGAVGKILSLLDRLDAFYSEAWRTSLCRK